MKKEFPLTQIVSFYYRALLDPNNMSIGEMKDIHYFFGINLPDNQGKGLSYEDSHNLEQAQDYLIETLPWLKDMEGFGIITCNSNRCFYVQEKEQEYGRMHELDNSSLKDIGE